MRAGGREKAKKVYELVEAQLRASSVFSKFSKVYHKSMMCR